MPPGFFFSFFFFVSVILFSTTRAPIPFSLPRPFFVCVFDLFGLSRV